MKADRHGDWDITTWFNKEVKDGSALGNTAAKRPNNKMNFAFIGRMESKHGGIHYIGEDVVIGKAHKSGRNEWWIGGSKMNGITAGPWAGAVPQRFKKKDKVGVAQAAFIQKMGVKVNHFDMGIIIDV